jgi:outer membrane protein assembly factor BamD
LNKRIYLQIFITLVITAIISGCSSSGSNITTDDPVRAFEIAKKKFDKKDYSDAVEDFSFIKIRFPGTEVSDKVQFYLAESYFYQKEYLLAEYEYYTFLKNYPLSPLAPDAKYKLGDTYYELSPKYSLDQEYTKEALNEFIEFVEQYPEHKNVGQADKKIKELRNKLAYKDFRTGEIYMKNDNYRAASLYFQNVYDTYIDSDFADDAMVSNAEALINGSRFDQAKAVLERFYKLFPNSDQKSRADKLINKMKEFQTFN